MTRHPFRPQEAIKDASLQREVLVLLANNRFADASRLLFGLSPNDGYTYHATASVSLDMAQTVVGLGRANGLHAWYRADDGSPRDPPPQTDVEAYVSVFTPSTVTTSALKNLGTNAKKGSIRSEVARHLDEKRFIHASLTSELAVPKCKSPPCLNPSLDFWAWSCRNLEWCGPCASSALVPTSHHVLPVLMHHFGCATPSHESLEVLKRLADGRPVVDVGSGNGYWSFLLRCYGLTVHAVDNMQSRWRVNWIDDTAVMDGVDWLRRRAGGKGMVMLLVYPVVGVDGAFTRELVGAFRGDTLAVVGTQNGNGYTGFRGLTMDQYMDKEHREWTRVVQIPLPSFPGKDEALFVFQRWRGGPMSLHVQDRTRSRSRSRDRRSRDYDDDGYARPSGGEGGYGRQDSYAMSDQMLKFLPQKYSRSKYKDRDDQDLAYGSMPGGGGGGASSSSSTRYYETQRESYYRTVEKSGAGPPRERRERSEERLRPVVDTGRSRDRTSLAVDDSGPSRRNRSRSRDGRGEREPSPRPAMSSSLTVDGRQAGSSRLSAAPASPLLESYRGTYQDCSPMPSPLLLPTNNKGGIDMMEALTPPLAYHSDVSEDESSKRSRRARFHDPQDIATTIAQALRGEGRPDTRPLVDILPSLTHEQVVELRAEYKRLVKTGVDRKGVNVAKHLRARLKDDDAGLAKACYAVALGRWESEAYWANFWYQGDKTRRELLIEALMGRTNDEIRHVKDAFADKKYGDSLITCMRTELKEDKFKKAVLLVLDECRMEDYDAYGRRLPLDHDLVDEDVADLRRAVKADKGGESAMIDIVVRRNHDHLRAILAEYEHRYRANFAREALKRSGNLVGELLAHVLNGVINRPVRDALLLHHALNASRKDDLRRELLISRLVRFHWDPAHMQAVRRAFRDRYGKDLGDAIRDAVSGPLGRFCAGLCIARVPNDVRRVERLHH
ncbi:hypothetical protein L249_4746 [Ophiocordyceps polyrhachis-furcata BCC 54312]|uniref:Annexin n=1 Tax=Ophiocordyceps polyrhachis-furcata BCC 54312 TaxID=1330021 RepID=A0A367L2V3_9HYPO|nr:hypothetical protein L249_4746 [Ophiocordyceps polyrhachis-furcata BCC 54312]